MVSIESINTNETDHPLLSKYEGLTTEKALNNLYDEVSQFLNTHKNQKKERFVSAKILRNSFHHLSFYSTFSWIPIAVLFFFLIPLLAFNLSRYTVLVISLLMMINIVIVYWDNYLRVNEFDSRISYILKLLKKIQKKNDWHVEHLPNLYTPHSPSVSLQWTIRDGKLVNLPTVLLAKDDIIVMRPGHQCPAEAVALIPSNDNKYDTLMPDQLFACDLNLENSESRQTEINPSMVRQPFDDKVFKVKKAPYIANLVAICDKYLDRPTSLYNKARYLLFGKCVHHVSLPIFFILCEILALIRWYVLPTIPCLDCSKLQELSYLFVVEPATVIISLASLMIPICWFIGNTIGNAAVLSCCPLLENREKPPKTLDKLIESLRDSENPYFIDVESSPQKDQHRYNLERWNTFRQHFLNLITNDGNIVAHCTNFLHTMASVTVLCCVDKKGVLSWPNPTAEKVFFLKNGANKNRRSTSEMSGPSFRNFPSPAEGCDSPEDGQKSSDGQIEVFPKTYPYVEILDITPRDDMGSAWKIEFDDSRWRAHLASLKPLGLAILLNTCNQRTHKSYNQFCAHITNHALYSQHLVPVGNRRCLCELARQIGFCEGAIEQEFNLELELFSYNNLKASQTENKYVQAFFKTRKPKFPFPHAMSAVVNTDKSKKLKLSSSMKEKRKKLSFKYKEKQMFSQGTADVILDYCIDYWDGQDVLPLTPAHRKKILDFYQRSSLTAYCTAFSYRPVYKNFDINRTINDEPVSVYLELIKTSEHRQHQKKRRRRRKRYQEHENDARSNRIHLSIRNKHFFLSHNTHFRNEGEKMTIQEVNECEEEIEIIEGEDGNVIEELEYYDYYDDDDEEDDDYDDYSGYDEPDEERGKPPEKPFYGEQEKHSVASMDYFQILNKQIFLGMVSMQYQPLHDMVAMVEELEKACIRFVHFSKENELRSRVFSEKMGLESGWNCHISLLSDADTNQRDSVSGNENPSVVPDPESIIETGASSADDEEKVPFAFDMSNRAKLPCGIRNIKPHLEQVDNVPLLVSLFTDCTSDTTEQMLSIMQEYGQIVCVLGSSANLKNFSLFAQADASISVEPLYAQVCQQIPPSSPPSDGKEPLSLSPIELSQVLNSLPCSLILQRQYGCHRALPIHPVMAESRNIMRLIWNCSQFWLCSIALTSCVQFLSLLLLLPAILTLEQSLWISCIVIPCLSISLATAPNDESVMSKAIGKDWLCSVNWTTISYSLSCYGTKLLCGIISTVLSYMLVLMSTCKCLTESHNNLTSLVNGSVPIDRFWIYIIPPAGPGGRVLHVEYISALNIIQCYMGIVITLHLVALCTSFLYRDSVFWRKLPCLNLLWLVIILLPISLQVAHFFLMINHSSVEEKISCILSNSLFSVKGSLFSFLPPLMSYVVCEIVKIYEIRSNKRYQKKVRLEFGTKLGMNSPF